MQNSTLPWRIIRMRFTRFRNQSNNQLEEQAGLDRNFDLACLMAKIYVETRDKFEFKEGGDYFMKWIGFQHLETFEGFQEKSSGGVMDRKNGGSLNSGDYHLTGTEGNGFKIRSELADEDDEELKQDTITQTSGSTTKNVNVAKAISTATISTTIDPSLAMKQNIDNTRNAQGNLDSFNVEVIKEPEAGRLQVCQIRYDLRPPESKLSDEDDSVWPSGVRFVQKVLRIHLKNL